MSDPELQSSTTSGQNHGLLATAVNIFTAPSEAFSAIRSRPHILFPMATVLISTMAVMGWYFAVLDFDWYIDDTLGRLSSLDESQLEQARERMEALSQRNTMLLSIFGSAISISFIYLLQAGYLTLVAALAGDEIRFKQWFSLCAWTNLPYLLVSVSMAVNIILNPNGQLSIYDLNGLSLSNLGMQTDNGSLNQMFSSLSLAQFWNLALLVAAYQQWLSKGLLKSAAIVIAPYLAIYGIWAYFALT